MALLFLYVDDVLTPQETRVQTSTACYGNSFTFLYVVFVPHRKQTYGFLRRVIGTALPVTFVHDVNPRRQKRK
jgi:hypothetical protein